DLLFVSHSQEEIDRVKGGLREQYGIKDLGDASCILGIDLVRHPDGSVFLSQRAYLETVLARLGQANCHPASTPMIQDISLVSLDKKHLAEVGTSPTHHSFPPDKGEKEVN
ncbi:hypothetical protein JCM1840_002363, partial [Sporobolomyces johnsonii]